MSEKYTEEDLLAEAASVINAAIPVDRSEVDGSMVIGEVESTRTEMGDFMTWPQLLPDEDEFEEAVAKVHAMVTEAADTSQWAVEMGRDGLEAESMQLTIDVGEHKTRLYFAFSKGISYEDRASICMGLSRIIMNQA